MIKELNCKNDTPYKIFHNSMDMEKIGFAVPDDPCRCILDKHNCNKKITHIDTDFLKFISKIENLSKNVELQERIDKLNVTTHTIPSGTSVTHNDFLTNKNWMTITEIENTLGISFGKSKYIKFGRLYNTNRITLLKINGRVIYPIYLFSSDGNTLIGVKVLIDKLKSDGYDDLQIANFIENQNKKLGGNISGYLSDINSVEKLFTV